MKRAYQASVREEDYCRGRFEWSEMEDIAGLLVINGVEVVGLQAAEAAALVRRNHDVYIPKIDCGGGTSMEGKTPLITERKAVCSFAVLMCCVEVMRHPPKWNRHNSKQDKTIMNVRLWWPSPRGAVQMRAKNSGGN